jgi:hypothetical protein
LSARIENSNSTGKKSANNKKRTERQVYFEYSHYKRVFKTDLPFCRNFSCNGKTDSSERTEKLHQPKAGQLTYGAYRTFALQMWLGAQASRRPKAGAFALLR